MGSLLQHGFGVLLCFAVTFVNTACLRDSYEVKLSGPVTITDQWIHSCFYGCPEDILSSVWPPLP